MINLFSILHQLYSQCGQMAHKKVTNWRLHHAKRMLKKIVVGNFSEGDGDVSVFKQVKMILLCYLS